MEVERGIVRTHVHSWSRRHVDILEVLYGVLYPEAHNTVMDSKKKIVEVAAINHIDDRCGTVAEARTRSGDAASLYST
jgi:hypothetical protein